MYFIYQSLGINGLKPYFKTILLSYILKLVSFDSCYDGISPALKIISGVGMSAEKTYFYSRQENLTQ